MKLITTQYLNRERYLSKQVVICCCCYWRVYFNQLLLLLRKKQNVFLINIYFKVMCDIFKLFTFLPQCQFVLKRVQGEEKSKSK